MVYERKHGKHHTREKNGTFWFWGYVRYSACLFNCWDREREKGNINKNMFYCHSFKVSSMEVNLSIVLPQIYILCIITRMWAQYVYGTYHVESVHTQSTYELYGTFSRFIRLTCRTKCKPFPRRGRPTTLGTTSTADEEKNRGRKKDRMTNISSAIQ